MEEERRDAIGGGGAAAAALGECRLQKFKLYETQSYFYLIGQNKSKNIWRVLKISRLECSELSIVEDPTIYTALECSDILERIHEGNKSMGGLKFVTVCYGIIGLMKFLGPYYMLLIKRRRKIGTICGHTIYAITKSEIITVPNPAVQSNMAVSKDENRYKRLLCMMDLTKDFYYSYSYHVMSSLQKNVCNNETGQNHHETMFVWNEYLTCDMKRTINSNLWTVALVYGFFKQVKLSVANKDLILTLIARRSRFYAGTRYLKRGVNRKGKVANDVETEQIIIEDNLDGLMKISSVVQVRGSIPLFWSQDSSKFVLKPDIILSKKDVKYEATRLHFEDLSMRYGNPIVILNLIKTHERKPRETILLSEFVNAVRVLNQAVPKEDRLRFFHFDLQRHSSKASNALSLLSKVATDAVNLTGIFYCKVINDSQKERIPSFSVPKHEYVLETSSIKEDLHVSEKLANGRCNFSVNSLHENLKCQKGVLRTNCIDCLDRTNVAQYVYGFVAMGRQLHILGALESPELDSEHPVAKQLMDLYESMGDTLALQYGGSPAHNKIFSERRGQWKAAIQSQDFWRSLQRYYSNAWIDGQKQNVINLFLGSFQPQLDKPSLWELISDLREKISGSIPGYEEGTRSFMIRSLSAGSLPSESDMPISSRDLVGKDQLLDRTQAASEGLSESSPEIPACKCVEANFSEAIKEEERANLDHIYCDEHGKMYEISSSANSCDEEAYEISSITGVAFGTSDRRLLSEATRTEYEGGFIHKVDSDSNFGDPISNFSNYFVQWVDEGGSLFH